MGRERGGDAVPRDVLDFPNDVERPVLARFLGGGEEGLERVGDAGRAV